MTARNTTPPAEPIVESLPTLPATAEPFMVNDEKSANWYLRKLANITGEQQRVQAQAAQIIAQLQNDADCLKRLYEGELKEYVRRTLEANGNRRRSITLLQGTCAFRTVPAGVRLTDTNAALRFARECGGMLKTVETLDAEAYRIAAARDLESGGELYPGMETTPERESFSVRFGSKAD